MAPSQQFDRACQRSSKEDRLDFISISPAKIRDKRKRGQEPFVFGLPAISLERQRKRMRENGGRIVIDFFRRKLFLDLLYRVV